MSELLQLDQAMGDIRIQGAAVDGLVVTIVAQRHRDDPREPEVTTARDGSELRLAFGFAAADVAEHQDWKNRRIDVGVRLPADLAIEVRTEAGRIELKKLAAAAKLATHSGDIDFKGSGELQARSRQGAIRAMLLSTQNDEPITASTTNGDVTVSLLEGASATVEVVTEGLLITDYSIDIERKHGSRRKLGRAVVGAGRRSIRLSSENGKVRLASVIVDEKLPVDAQ